MRILHLGNAYFLEPFKQLGHDAKWAGHDPTADVPLPHALVDIDSVLGQLPPHWNPDLVILGDESTQPLVLGLETLAVPLVWYAIDSHVHANWHGYYGTVFDAIFVAQRDWVPAYRMDEDRQIVYWLPLFCHSSADRCLGLDRDISLSFVGTLDPRLNPDRVELVRRIQERFPIQVRSGSYLETFNQSMMVLNQSVASEVNFRTFQAMACGALLVTGRVGNGFDELFEDRRHCAVYEKGNVDQILDLVNYFHAHRTEREAIAREGHVAVLAMHANLHRAQTILDAVTNRPLHQQIKTRQSRRASIEWCLASVYESSARRYLQAAGRQGSHVGRSKFLSIGSQYQTLAMSIRTKLAELAHA